jgi:hypothetical protein
MSLFLWQGQAQSIPGYLYLHALRDVFYSARLNFFFEPPQSAPLLLRAPARFLGSVFLDLRRIGLYRF